MPLSIRSVTFERARLGEARHRVLGAQPGIAATGSQRRWQPSLANARRLRAALVEFGFGSLIPEAAEVATCYCVKFPPCLVLLQPSHHGQLSPPNPRMRAALRRTRATCSQCPPCTKPGRGWFHRPWCKPLGSTTCIRHRARRNRSRQWPWSRSSDTCFRCRAGRDRYNSSGPDREPRRRSRDQRSAELRSDCSPGLQCIDRVEARSSFSVCLRTCTFRSCTKRPTARPRRRSGARA
jgi:hypothetical protein